MSLQKFSIFHETSEICMRAWHKPYAELLRGCKRVLDVGCGPGYFSDELRVLNVKSLGVDLDPDMVSMSVKRGHDAVIGNQDLLSNFSNEFDGVHISHVVEHLWGDELETLLTSSFNSLVVGGLIVIRTPNWDNRFVRERLFWMDHTHKRPYPKELLVRMLEDLGMQHITSGSEPFGMNDTFVVAGKHPIDKAAVSDLTFPNLKETKMTIAERVKSRIRSRLQAFLGIQ
jgi:SAM-dependent methyltransferase